MNDITFGEILTKFKLMFPDYKNEILDYRPQNGQKYSIHIWFKDGRELVFSLIMKIN